jgi:CRP-like cAMP-binding protein
MLYVDGNNGNSNGDARIWLTTFIIGLVCSYNVAAIYIFGKTLIGTAIQNRKDRRSTLQGDTANSDTNSTLTIQNNTVIVPSTTSTSENSEVEKVAEENNSSGAIPNTQVVVPTSQHSNENETGHQINGMTRVRSARSQIVHNIHEEHRLSQAGLQQSIDMRQRKQRRQTQIRLNARTKLKKQKTLSNIPAFAVLTEKEIETMIDNMTHEKHLIGTTLCTKGEVATKFYVIMKGECGAYITMPEQGKDQKVGKIPTFSFFGENALIDNYNNTAGQQLKLKNVRNATVKVDSESVSLLVLTKETFNELVATGKLNSQVLAGMEKVDLERQAENSSSGGSRGSMNETSVVEVGEIL